MALGPDSPSQIVGASWGQFPVGSSHLSRPALSPVSSPRPLRFPRATTALGLGPTYVPETWKSPSSEESWGDYDYGIFFFYQGSSSALAQCLESVASYLLFTFIVIDNEKLRLMSATKSWPGLENPWYIFIHLFLWRQNSQNNHFKVDNSVASGMFTMLYDHHLCLVPKHFHYTKMKSCAH